MIILVSVIFPHFSFQEVSVSTGEPVGTKQAIFIAAADLFARNNYHHVSMKQIAAAVGIKASSIYNHYPSKESILLAIYQYFDDNMMRNSPDLDELLHLAEFENPREVMRKTNMVYPDEILETMARAMLVTTSMVHNDPRADALVCKNFIDMPFIYDIPLLEKMQALGRIEPIDPHHFALLHSSYCYSAAVRFYTNHAISTPDYFIGMDLLFQLIIPTCA
ncbi:MAG: TetR/AcrR family transcriptional regulator [Oscillospiraceae bacterium]